MFTNRVAWHSWVREWHSATGSGDPVVIDGYLDDALSRAWVHSAFCTVSNTTGEDPLSSHRPEDGALR
jgi:hypothetical protein